LLLKRCARTIGEVIYGATIYDMLCDLRKERARREQFFALIMFGDLFGLPLLPTYYSMRLLPYVVPSLSTWRRSILREKDLTDILDQELG